jgi:hypothetical protein
MPLKYKVSVDISEVAEKLQQTKETIEQKLMPAMQSLAVQAHTFIVQKAQTELSGYQQKAYLGEKGENLKFDQIAKGMWVIELSEKASWLEEGRQSVFMGWLLNSPKAKTAKDGSKYLSIPFTQERGAGGKFNNKMPGLQTTIVNALKRQKISLKKIEKNPDGTPKYGVLHKLSIEPPGTSSQYPGLFSAPRSKEMAALTGLPAHEGIYYLQGAVVIQRPGKKEGSVIKEAVTFRTISSKHEQEGRWFYPEVKGLKAFPAAEEWAKKEMDSIVSYLEQELGAR